MAQIQFARAKIRWKSRKLKDKSKDYFIGLNKRVKTRTSKAA
jgi:hypothetical protein